MFGNLTALGSFTSCFTCLFQLQLTIMGLPIGLRFFILIRYPAYLIHTAHGDSGLVEIFEPRLHFFLISTKLLWNSA